jgi:mono/diheme cytochrome c family protein
MLADYLATGHAANGATAGGPMLEAIEKSFSRMTRDDLEAMATYLLPAGPAEAVAPAAASASPAALTPVQGDDTPQALAAMSAGARVYMNNCASCHNTRAGPQRPAVPAAASAAAPANADNVAMAILLEGVLPEHGQGMIGFAHTLNDAEIAAVTNYSHAGPGRQQGQHQRGARQDAAGRGEASPLLWRAWRDGAAGTGPAGARRVRWRCSARTVGADTRAARHLDMSYQMPPSHSGRLFCAR